MSTLREALLVFVDGVAAEYEKKEADLVAREKKLVDDLAAHTKSIYDQLQDVAGRARTLTEREAKFEERNASMASLSQTSANRKAKIETLERNQTELVTQKNKAVADQRFAEEEKDRLERVVGTLVREKKELKQQLAIAGGAAPIATDVEPAVQEAHEDKTALVEAAA